MDFDFFVFIVLGLVFLIIVIEVYGDIIVNLLILGEFVEGKIFIKCVLGGILVDGFNLMMVGIFNFFLNFVFV